MLTPWRVFYMFFYLKHDFFVSEKVDLVLFPTSVGISVPSIVRYPQVTTSNDTYIATL